jgi:hypothetical protein
MRCAHIVLLRGWDHPTTIEHETLIKVGTKTTCEVCGSGYETTDLGGATTLGNTFNVFSQLTSNSAPATTTPPLDDSTNPTPAAKKLTSTTMHPATPPTTSTPQV